MAKLFYKVDSLSTLEANISSLNDRSIYFIEDIGMLYTRGSFFGTDSIRCYVNRPVTIFYTNNASYTDTFTGVNVSNKKGVTLALTLENTAGTALTPTNISIVSQTGIGTDAMSLDYNAAKTQIHLYNTTSSTVCTGSNDLVIKVEYDDAYTTYLNVSIKLI